MAARALAAAGIHRQPERLNVPPLIGYTACLAFVLVGLTVVAQANAYQCAAAWPEAERIKPFGFLLMCQVARFGLKAGTPSNVTSWFVKEFTGNWLMSAVIEENRCGDPKSTSIHCVGKSPAFHPEDRIPSKA